MRLLVIEDDDTLRESLTAQLTDAGYAVEQAADGREGLYFAMEYPVDLAIIDLGLPEVSGLDIIREAGHLRQAEVDDREIHGVLHREIEPFPAVRGLLDRVAGVRQLRREGLAQGVVVFDDQQTHPNTLLTE